MMGVARWCSDCHSFGGGGKRWGSYVSSSRSQHRCSARLRHARTSRTRASRSRPARRSCTRWVVRFPANLQAGPEAGNTPFEAQAARTAGSVDMQRLATEKPTRTRRVACCGTGAGARVRSGWQRTCMQLACLGRFGPTSRAPPPRPRPSCAQRSPPGGYPASARA